MTVTRKALDSILIASITIVFFAILVTLHKGLAPTVFSDEWIYSRAARLLPLSESNLSSYLYLFLFGSTNYCGSGFLECARVLNTIFFALGFPLIYLISIKLVSRKTALFILILSMLCPMTSYTAYFMPESLYFFSFWIFAWFVLSNIKNHPGITGIGIGFILCLMSFIKMHAIFLIPAMMIFLGLISFYRVIDLNKKQAFLNIVYMLITFILSRELLGVMIAGHHGLNIIGENYNYNAIAAFNLHRLLLIFEYIKIPLLGHLLALTVLFCVPLAIMINTLFSKNDQTTDVKLLIFFSFSCLISLLFFTTFTTTEIVGWNQYESLNRIHLRYYAFIFPLFFIIAASAKNSLMKIGVAALFAISFSAIFFLRNKYVISFIDCPELFGIAYSKIIFEVVSCFSFICLAVWAIQQKWGIRIYLYLFLPLTLLVSNYFVNYELRQERLYRTDVYDRAGRFAHDYLGSEVNSLTVIGSEQAGLDKTLFYLDNPRVSKIALPADFPIELAKIPEDTKWILLIGNYHMLRKPEFRISMGDFTLVKFKT